MVIKWQLGRLNFQPHREPKRAAEIKPSGKGTKHATPNNNKVQNEKITGGFNVHNILTPNCSH